MNFVEFTVVRRHFLLFLTPYSSPCFMTIRILKAIQNLVWFMGCSLTASTPGQHSLLLYLDMERLGVTCAVYAAPSCLLTFYCKHFQTYTNVETIGTHILSTPLAESQHPVGREVSWHGWSGSCVNKQVHRSSQSPQEVDGGLSLLKSVILRHMPHWEVLEGPRRYYFITLWCQPQRTE